jgi:arginyl-tRNA synthetase
VFYVTELANDFQSYFTRLKTDPILPQASVRAQAGWEKSWDFPKTSARLAWVEAIRTVYAASLALLGVSAPERMERPESTSTQGVGSADLGPDEGEGDDEKE